MTRHIPFIMLAAALAIPTTAAAQDSTNVGDALRKTRNADLKKKTPKVSKVWTKGGTCHERRTRELQATNPYTGRCMNSATRHAGEMFSCAGRQGQIVNIRVGGRNLPVYEAKLIVCTRNAAGKKYQIGYSAGQQGTLTSDKAADFVCGCYEPPGGEQCDEGFAGTCYGTMASLETPAPEVYEGLDALAYLVTHALEIDWSRTLGFAAA